MNKKNKIILGVILVAVLLIGIGYAAVLGEIPLTIGGSATASADGDNFKVYFTNENTTVNPEQDANIKVEATAVPTKTSATVTITGLTTKDQEAFAVLEIKNASVDINASNVTVTTDGSDNNTDYFEIKAEMCDATGATPVVGANPVVAGEVTYVKVSAKLIKNPTKTETATINVVVTATPEIAQ